MIKCPACGTDNPDTGNFCIACGVDLTATAVEDRLRSDSAARAAGPASGTEGRRSQPAPPVDMPPEYLASSPPEAAPSRPAPVKAPAAAAPSAGAGARPAAKDRTLALVLEVLPGVFGILGIGWMYAGNVSAGLLWLVGYLIGNVVAVVLDLVTFGAFVCIHVPLALACLLVSAILLFNYTRRHPELFGP